MDPASLPQEVDFVEYKITTPEEARFWRPYPQMQFAQSRFGTREREIAERNLDKVLQLAPPYYFPIFSLNFLQCYETFYNE